MGNDAHVSDVGLLAHQLMDLVCRGSSASWAVRGPCLGRGMGRGNAQCDGV